MMIILINIAVVLIDSELNEKWKLECVFGDLKNKTNTKLQNKKWISETYNQKIKTIERIC